MPNLGRQVVVSGDDLIRRLAAEAGSPHTSPRLSQHQRIARKIDAEYARGNLDRAARWDERLTGWEDRVDDAMADVQDNWAEMSGGQAVDDAGTGVALRMAATYGDYVGGIGALANRSDLAANLRAAAEEGLGRYPAPRQPPDNEILEFARQVFEKRQALRDRYHNSPPMQVMTADELIRRLGQ